ncbi:hypothetical protein ABZU76_14640 [Amycolatopsis sp. NPDC005232]|uniref:hypothetical protein n=1 Tax=Amycolatopsis sp. NPDC005232 TaxID=3157027 RepID=UPI0033A06895
MTFRDGGSDPLAGRALPGRFSYPVYHRGEHGTLAELIGDDHALISIGVDTETAFDATDRAFLDQLPCRFVRILPPDESGIGGYCDLDFAFTAVLAANRRQAAVVHPNGRIAGSVEAIEDLPSLLRRVRGELLRN